MKQMKVNNKLKTVFRYLVTVLVFLGFFSQNANGQLAKKKVSKICIDAGHGGKDGGCHGAYSNEKDVTLAVALKVEKLIKANLKDLAVVQTRTTDIFWELEERGSIANNSKCDLFLSIHVNSTPRRIGTSNGTETWVLGLTRNDDKENAMAEKGEGFVEEGMLNTNDPMTQIIIAQYQQAFLSQSINFGAKIENEFAAQGRMSKGVKQKSLGVLANSGMPGALVEIGFLNNPDEENLLNSEDGQNQVAQAIFNGIKAYKTEVETAILKN
jgi:N-acetylmuramoyl-L-alanine amidase